MLQKLNSISSTVKLITFILLALSFLVSPVYAYENIEDENLQNYMLEDCIEDYNIISSWNAKLNIQQIFENDIGVIVIRTISFSDNTKNYLLEFMEDYYIIDNDDGYIEYTEILGLGDKGYKVKFFPYADINYHKKVLIFSKNNLIIIVDNGASGTNYTELFVFANLQLDVIDFNIKSDLQSNVDTETVSITMTQPQRCIPYEEELRGQSIYKCNPAGSDWDLIETCPTGTVPDLNEEGTHIECRELTPTTPSSETIPGFKIFSVVFLICLVSIFIRSKR